jgi:histidyl-tRNA synthetase
MERLILLMGEDLEKFRPTLPVFFVTPDEAGKNIAFTLANQLRVEGVRTEIDHSGRSMKSQMKRADRLKAQYVVIIGGSEVEKNEVVLRNMSTKAQENILIQDLVKKIKGSSL